MKIAGYIALLCVFLPFASIAQSDSIQPRFARLYALSASGGMYVFNNYLMSREQYQKMNPGNGLLKKDISAYENMGSNNENSGANVSINASLIFYNKRKKAFNHKQELQFGISYHTNEKVKQHYRLEEKVPFDTLISNTSATQYYIDTIKTNRYIYSHERTAVVMDISHTFHSKQNRIFSYYAGYGLAYGRIINSITYAEHYYNEDFKDQNHKTYDYPESNHATIDMSERSIIKGGNIYQASLRVGGIMRFSSIKKNQMKRLAFNLDARPGVRLSQIPGYGTITQFFVNVNAGVKIYLNKEAIH